MFNRESSLYRRFGNVMPAKVPKMYFGQAVQESGLGILLLEEVHAISKDNMMSGKGGLNESETIRPSLKRAE